MLNNKILIIDDEQAVIDSIRDSLKKEEYEILSANNGQDGIEIYNEEKPILIILDLRMPVMDGIEFLEHLKLTPSDPCFVIVLTGHGDNDAMESCFNLGISSFLKKPFNVYELMGLVSHSITLKQTQIELTKHKYRLENMVKFRTLKLTRVNTNLRDEIDERKKIENKLLKLTIAVEQNPGVVMITDTAGCIEYVNPKFTELTGYTSAEVIGRNPRFLKSEEQAQNIYVQLWSTITSGHEWHGDLHNKKKNDKFYWESASISPIRDSKGIITHFVKTSEDITMRKLSEEKIKKAYDELESRIVERTAELRATHEKLIHSVKLSAVGKLAASIAHEFNNPLFGVLNVLEKMKAEVGVSEDGRAFIDMAINECVRMADLIKKLQDFNRPSSSVVSPTDIHKSIDEMLILFQTKLKARKIKLKKTYATGIPVIMLVEDQIKQVILNILNNAEHSISSDGGEIIITTEYINNEINVHIKDSGHGIKPDDLNHIFEPFFTTKAVKGTGLGLSVSYGIIKDHGGDIKVESTQGVGTTFTITLPVT